MRFKKQKIALSVVGIAVAGWLVGRALGPSVRPGVVAAVAPPIVDNHVAVRDPVLKKRMIAAVAFDDRRPELQMPAARFHPRDEGEWQGMLVDMSMRQTCDVSERCGLGLSCRSDGQCGPCEVDADCASGEACVLDHCLPAENVECSARAECAYVGEEAVCVLSGLTGGEPRGNSKMRAFCLEGTGGKSPTPDQVTPRVAGRVERPPFDRRDLVEDLRLATSEGG